MPRAMWSGSISFGLVNVPVKLYSAVSKKDVRFHLLHDRDGVRLQQKRVCPADGEVVAYENVVRGYEIAPDQYVVLTAEELAAADPKATRAMDILDFVDLEDIDPIYFERPYYLVPEKTAGKAYSLLRESMNRLKKVAIARVVIRDKQHLVAIRPMDRLLVMSTMLYGDEVVPMAALEGLPEEVQPNERELAVAEQIIQSLADEFDPDKYRDDYRARVLEIIQRKAEGQEIVVQPVEEPAPVADLLAALEASLAQIKEQTPEQAGSKRSA